MKANFILHCAVCGERIGTLLEEVDTAIIPDKLQSKFKQIAGNHREQCIYRLINETEGQK